MPRWGSTKKPYAPIGGVSRASYNNATGGTITTFVSTGQAGTTTGRTYRVHSFTTTGANSLVVTAATKPFDWLVVGGGGGNGWGNGGGGGAGAFKQTYGGTLTAQTYSITVGAAAQSSVFNSITAGAGAGGGGEGGGGGGGANGSSGGGGGMQPNARGDWIPGGAGSSPGYGGGAGSMGWDYDSNGAGGGGGGAGGGGGNGGYRYGGGGGTGVSSAIRGTAYTYCYGGNGMGTDGPGGGAGTYGSGGATQGIVVVRYEVAP